MTWDRGRELANSVQLQIRHGAECPEWSDTAIQWSLCAPWPYGCLWPDCDRRALAVATRLRITPPSARLSQAHHLLRYRGSGRCSRVWYVRGEVALLAGSWSYGKSTSPSYVAASGSHILPRPVPTRSYASTKPAQSSATATTRSSLSVRPTRSRRRRRGDSAANGRTSVVARVRRDDHNGALRRRARSMS